MKPWTILTKLLLITLLAFSASGVVSVKVASGHQNLGPGLHQGGTAFNPLMHLAKIDFSTTTVLGSPVATKGSLKNASGKLDDAAQAARTQRRNTPNLTQHARERMAGSRGDGQTVSIDRVQEAIDKGRITSTRGSVVNRRINAADSGSG
jgi:hypothetical protein